MPNMSILDFHVHSATLVAITATSFGISNVLAFLAGAFTTTTPEATMKIAHMMAENAETTDETKQKEKEKEKETPASLWKELMDVVMCLIQNDYLTAFTIGMGIATTTFKRIYTSFRPEGEQPPRTKGWPHYFGRGNLVVLGEVLVRGQTWGSMPCPSRALWP